MDYDMDPNDSKRPDTQAEALKKPDFSTPNDLVKFIVTEDGVERALMVHKEFACYHSPVLRAAFNSTFIEGLTQEYRFDRSITYYTVLLFVRWPYNSSLKPNQIKADLWGRDELNSEYRTYPDQTDVGYDKFWTALARLWLLSEELLIPELQNQIIDNFSGHYREAPQTAALFEFVYNNTGSGSLLRKAMIVLVSKFGSPERIRDDAESYPHQMLGDLAAEALERKLWLENQNFPTSPGI